MTHTLFILLAIFAISSSPILAAAPLDFDGDGRSDLVVTRDVPNGEGQPFLDWYIKASTNPDSYYSVQFGLGMQNVALPTIVDIPVPRDFDGDLKTDIAVWRRGTESVGCFFYILNSSNNTVRGEQFGIYDDQATVSNDFDGDNIADLAVLRTPDVSHPTNSYIYKGTLNNPNGNLTYVAVNGGNNPRAINGDFDGDGRADFGVHNINSNTYQIRLSSTLLVETMTFGTQYDYVMTGDHDGDGKTDLMFIRINSRQGFGWYILERDGGGTGMLNPIYFGTPSTTTTFASAFAGNDYDGDGRSDLLVVNRSSTGGTNFNYRRSSDGSIRTVNFGLLSDRLVMPN